MTKCPEKCLILSIFLNDLYFKMPFMCNGFKKMLLGTNLDYFVLDLYKKVKGMLKFFLRKIDAKIW